VIFFLGSRKPQRLKKASELDAEVGASKDAAGASGGATKKPEVQLAS
jgi:hypothetical protein